MKTQQSFQEQERGKIYLVPTPIGNLEDMTFRAVRILKEVDLIAAEDTRNTQKLLNHFDIDTQQISFHEHNARERAAQLVERALNGEAIAQVSDAGMPSISDPGVELVKAAVEAEVDVIPLPGANAALTALIASGVTPQPFYFYGFLPRKKKEMKQELAELNKREETLLFYESPHRLKQVLEQMQEVFGEDRQLTLARELTKRYEEFVRGSVAEVVEWAEENQIRGEFVVVVDGNPHAEDLQEAPEWSEWTVEEHVAHIMEQRGLPSKQAIKEVASVREMPKREVYAAYHGI